MFPFPQMGIISTISIHIPLFSLLIILNLVIHGNAESALESEHCAGISCGSPPIHLNCERCKRPHPRAEKHLGLLKDCCPHWCCTDQNKRRILFIGVSDNNKQRDLEQKQVQLSGEERTCSNISCPISFAGKMSCKLDPNPPGQFQSLHRDYNHCCPKLQCKKRKDNTVIKSFRMIEDTIPIKPNLIREEKGFPIEGNLCPKVQCMKRPTTIPDVDCEEVIIPIQEGLSPQERDILNEFHECCPSVWKCTNEDDGWLYLIYGVMGQSFKYYSTVIYTIKDGVSESDLGHCENMTCLKPPNQSCTVLDKPSPEIVKFAKNRTSCCPAYNCTNSDEGKTILGFASIQGTIPKSKNTTNGVDCENISCGSRPISLKASCTPSVRKTTISRALGELGECCNGWDCLFPNNVIYNYYQIYGPKFTFQEIETIQHDSNNSLILLVDKKDMVNSTRFPVMEAVPSTTENSTKFYSWTEKPIVVHRQGDPLRTEEISKSFVGGNETNPTTLIEQRTYSNTTCIRYTNTTTLERPVTLEDAPYINRIDKITHGKVDNKHNRIKMRQGSRQLLGSETSFDDEDEGALSKSNMTSTSTPTPDKPSTPKVTPSSKAKPTSKATPSPKLKRAVKVTPKATPANKGRSVSTKVTSPSKRRPPASQSKATPAPKSKTTSTPASTKLTIAPETIETTRVTTPFTVNDTGVALFGRRISDVHSEELNNQSHKSPESNEQKQEGIYNGTTNGISNDSATAEQNSEISKQQTNLEKYPSTFQDEVQQTNYLNGMDHHFMQLQNMHTSPPSMLQSPLQTAIPPIEEPMAASQFPFHFQFQDEKGISDPTPKTSSKAPSSRNSNDDDDHDSSGPLPYAEKMPGNGDDPPRKSRTENTTMSTSFGKKAPTASANSPSEQSKPNRYRQSSFYQQRDKQQQPKEIFNVDEYFKQMHNNWQDSHNQQTSRAPLLQTEKSSASTEPEVPSSYEKANSSSSKASSESEEVQQNIPFHIEKTQPINDQSVSTPKSQEISTETSLSSVQPECDATCPKLKLKANCRKDNSPQSKKFLPKNENQCDLTHCDDGDSHRTYYVKYCGNIPNGNKTKIQEEMGISFEESTYCWNVQCQNESTIPSPHNCSEDMEAQPRLRKIKPFLECCPMLKCSRDDGSHSVELKMISKSFTYYEIAFYNVKRWETAPPPPNQLGKRKKKLVSNGNREGLKATTPGGSGIFNPNQIMEEQLRQLQMMQEQLGEDDKQSNQHQQKLFGAQSQFEQSTTIATLTGSSSEENGEDAF